MTTTEIIAEIRAGSLNREHLLALCDEHEQAITALARCAKERDSALTEFRLAREARNALRAELAAAQKLIRDRAALAGHADGLVKQAEQERDNLKIQLEWFDGIASERDALRAERDDWYRAGLSIASSLSMEPEVSCPGIVEAVRELINAKAALKTERDALRAEVARLAALVNELEHQRATATAEIDRLDVLIRDYRDAAAPDAP